MLDSTSAVVATTTTLINDNTVGGYTIAADKTQVVEGSAVTYTVTRTNTSAATLTYNIAGDSSSYTAATVGSDFTPATGTVTFAAGATTASFSFTPTSDSVTEGLEGFKVSLLDSNSAVVASTTGLINDSTATSSSGNAITLTTNTSAILSSTANTGATPSTSFMTTGNDAVTGAYTSAASIIVTDTSTTDADTINLTASAAVTAILTNIETINAAIYSSTVDLSSATGYSTVNVTGSGTATLGALVSGKTVNMNTATQNLTASAVAASSSLTLNLNGVTATYDDDGAGATKIATTSVASNTSANTLTLSNAIGTALNASGSQNLTVKGAYASFDAKTIGGASHTATLTVQTTGDTLASDEFAASGFTNVDMIILGDASDDDSLSGASIISGLTSGMTVKTMGEANAATDDLTLSLANSGLTDTLTLSIARSALANDGVTANTVGLIFDDLTTTGVETFTINSTGAGANTVATYVNTTNGNALVITGDKALTITDALPSTTASVDASSFTAALTLSGGGTGLNAIIGGSGADAITTGNQTADAIQITGGKGADTFTDTAGDVVTINYTATALTGGDVEGVTDTYTNVAAADKINFSATLEGLLKISGVALSALTADTALGATFSTTAGSETNIRFVDADDTVQIDINANGAYDAGTDLNIKLGAVGSVTYQHASDYFLLA